MTTIRTINNTKGTTTAMIIIVVLKSSSSRDSSLEELEGANDVNNFAVVGFRPLLAADVVEGVVKTFVPI